jgi:hypothetical protein
MRALTRNQLRSYDVMTICPTVRCWRMSLSASPTSASRIAVKRGGLIAPDSTSVETLLACFDELPTCRLALPIARA